MKQDGSGSIRVLVGGHLREELGVAQGELMLEVKGPLSVTGLLERLGLAQSRAKLILVNGKGSTPETVLGPGDRVAIFPPELSFNTFVSLSFRKERVLAREASRGEKKGASDA
jgi:molybdopterin converting factor small subunit